MSDRTAYEPGVPCWVDTLQADPEAAGEFYAGVLGWELDGRGSTPGDPPGRYLVGRVRGRDVAGIGSQPQAAAPPPSWSTYVRVDSAAAAAERARSAGGTVLAGPLDADPAGRLAVLADPAGASFCVWEPRRRQGAQAVNEPGAWAMSDLQTADPEGAAAFYGAVFGWTAEPLDVGGFAITLLRLPGYVGGEPEQPVPRDLVAVMSPLAGDAPPRWAVDFWVDDVDAAADDAVRLGGTVVTPPADMPVGRTAVLADREGAAFSVSRVIPAN